MTREQFLKKRQSSWKRFESLLLRTERDRGEKLNGDEIAEFSALYRSLCFDLSLIQSRDWGASMSRYLNNLATRGHNHLYRSRPGSLEAVVRFLTDEFPRLLRANGRYFATALALFAIPWIVVAIITARDPSLAGRILPGTSQEQMESMYSKSIAEQRDEVRSDSTMAGFYVRNNVGISFKCFALGAFAGLGTMVVLVYNSIYLGTVTGYLIGRGHGKNFLEFVIGHGSFELTAIAVSGTAGLILGHAIVHPGDYSRWDALKTRGLDAVKIAIGAGAMLVVAAGIEGFWSPSKAPFAVKIVVGVLLWAFVIGYLGFAGRSKRTDARTSPEATANAN